ncbi:GNAT family N-acetyltransferase [Demequina sp.]|uniref:GNAT family N-acetyltransferase n=1 Tax=Demequina sp. TaxID=2050685 RepID=UPI003D112D5D
MKVIAVTTPEELAAALEIRFEVFVDEQGVSPDSEADHLDDDPRTLHCLVVTDEDDFFGNIAPVYMAGTPMGPPPGTPLATGRLIAPNTDVVHGEGSIMDPANPHIGRLAVVAGARGTGAGRLAMGFLEQAALARHGANGAVRVELSAQDQAMPFYEKLGYTVHGDGYLDEGIPHHDAYKDIS